MKKLTQKELKKVLHYEPTTGLFTWVKKRQGVSLGGVAGCLQHNGYRHIGVLGKVYSAHRLAFLYMTGKFPLDEVDHKNHERSDNRWSNLREVTRLENSRNRSMHLNNKSGFSGVCWKKRVSKWLASISINGKRKHLGYFKDIDDAIEARKNANIEYGYHANHGEVA